MKLLSALKLFKPATSRHGFVMNDDLGTYPTTGTTRQTTGASEISRHSTRYPSPLDLNYF